MTVTPRNRYTYFPFPLTFSIAFSTYQPKILLEYTQFDPKELWKCMTLVAQKICGPAICASKRNLTAVKKKYENRKYLSVSSTEVLVEPNIRFVQYKGQMNPPRESRAA